MGGPLACAPCHLRSAAKDKRLKTQLVADMLTLVGTALRDPQRCSMPSIPWCASSCAPPMFCQSCVCSSYLYGKKHRYSFSLSRCLCFCFSLSRSLSFSFSFSFSLSLSRSLSLSLCLSLSLSLHDTSCQADPAKGLSAGREACKWTALILFACLGSDSPCCIEVVSNTSALNPVNPDRRGSCWMPLRMLCITPRND